MKPALQRLKASLDGIDEPAWCEGKAACGRLVFESRGDSCATDDPDALVAHYERATSVSSRVA